ncbi:uncharacterized protein FIESC28_04443 [Fusarium coffeatum]|uniref:TPX2 C-terminal domain-containing protein n=1 Tax=Fusarium coffeatum TaxID=231269 RepID=A0A366RZP6_9HYPO|nr:uncharacterized protein FIESC28_04443 [Fusarium coffeatum]RBR22551.1 hypothetical protein FIESC28_04443 [Fusarium coffeatum]
MDHQPQIYPATNKAPVSSGSANNRDVHFIEPKSTSSPSSSSSTRGALQELSARHIHNQGVAQNSPQQYQNQKLHLRPSAVKVPSSFRRARRSSTEPEAFELLEVVEEEDSNLSVASSPANSNRSVHQQSSEGYICKSHPLAEAWPSLSPHLDHRPGQFEWLVSFSAPTSEANNSDSPDIGESDHCKMETKVYGCTLLSRWPRYNLFNTPETDIYTFVATPLTPEEYMALGFEPPQTSFSTPNMALPPPPAYDDHQTLPLKVPEVVEVVEQAVSPSLTLISDRCSSYGGSSRNGSFSVPRIEDSFEELDKLEDELEAIDAFTQSRRIALPENVPTSKHLEPPSPAKMPTISKRASVIGMSSTVRVKPTEKSQVPLRRSTSLVFRDKKQNDSDDTLKPKPQFTRGNNSQSTPSKAPVKSTKAPTIPKFELPGEAVARRLKEQREARRAQQAEAQRAYVPPPRPKSSKPLTKPIFELPGEAISRRKREEREARLKAQEEEEKRKREFKARPMRNSFTPASIPRETIASLARQGKLPQEDTKKQANAAKTKRASILGPRPSPSSEGQIPQNRGRLSTATSQEHLSRGTSVSTGSGSGKRALTAEEAHQLKVRGKEIFQRDNNGYMRDKEREKREREEATRLAREQAAERSRIASREWAEKKRLKEQALLQAIRGQ